MRAPVIDVYVTISGFLRLAIEFLSKWSIDPCILPSKHLQINSRNRLDVTDDTLQPCILKPSQNSLKPQNIAFW